MSHPIVVPALGESVHEAIVTRWLIQVGDFLAVDQPIVELETDKITVEVPAAVAGILTACHAEVGQRVAVGDVIGDIQPGSAPATVTPTQATPVPAAVAVSAASAAPLMPAARAEAARQGVTAPTSGSGRGGRVLKEDVLAPHPVTAGSPAATAPKRSEGAVAEKRVAMSSLRLRISERLLQAQQQAAILTTFNEVDMSSAMDLRKQYKEAFAQKHGVKLGFMSLFVRAAVDALRAFPAVNAEIQGQEIVYKYHYDIGVAVGGGKGLVVPVIRDADRRSLAEIELEIERLASLAKTNKLQISDLSGGTFTISNGGVYGSMLSTPILNPPQTGILGLHNIVERPVAIGGTVQIRPIMYLALSYDHRLVDGREAVQFLVHIKQAMEDLRRLLLDL